MLKEKLKIITHNKYFIPVIVILINIIFFIIFNSLFEIKYEEIDDFTMMNIISKSDGSYNYLSIYIHPLLSYFIMMLFKTGININWYSVFLLTLQFVSFTLIGIILIKNNKKLGFLSYFLILITIYSSLLINLQYTSVATLTIIAGIMLLMYYIDKEKNKKYGICAFVFIVIGTMLRWKSIAIAIPFYFMYTIFYTIKNKNYTAIKNLIWIVLMVFLVYISNYIVYRLNPLYNEYCKFNEVRSYLFDSNILKYDTNKKIYDDNKWTNTDYKMLYSYSLNDENFYNFNNLNNLKNSLDIKLGDYINKAKYSMIIFYLCMKKNMILFLLTSIILMISQITQRNRMKIFLCFLLNILLFFVVVFSKPVYRVMISVYVSTIIIMSYFLTIDKNKEIIKRSNKWLILVIAILFTILSGYNTFKNASIYNRTNYEYIRKVINYTKENKENAYIYSTTLHDIYRSYSVFEKVEDDTFINLRSMSDWDMYNKEYYEFKEKFELNNIITDLYEKDNVYIITGNIRDALNNVYKGNNEHIELIQKYIKEHYNVEVNYTVVKEFEKNIKIYKLCRQN